MQINIGHRLQIMAGVAIGALIILAAAGLYVARSLHGSMDYIYKNTMPSLQAIDEINEDFLRLRLTVLYHFLQNEADKKATSDAQITKLKGKIRDGLARYEKELISDARDKALLDKDKGFFETYFTEIEPALERSRANDPEGIWVHVAKATAGMTRLSEAIAEHKQYNQDLADQFYKRADAEASAGRTGSLVLVILSLLVVGGLSFLVVREIRSRMGRLSAFINQVSQSLDFTPRIRVTRLDELGTTGDAINHLLDRLQENLKSIAASTRSVSEAAHQLATTSQQVSAAATQQSEAASGMAATVEEVTVSISHVADRAQEANALSSESGKLAQSGTEIIGQTTDSIHAIEKTVLDAAKVIHELEHHSQQIANVVQVIKDVADQTNLLALNAAIEAARAGEQGRGFAVVADEVRKLAERTSSSTKEISATIDAMKMGASNAVRGMEEVVDKVKEGVGRAQHANEAIQHIGESSLQTVEMVEEIASAIKEQGSATNSIAIHVERIAQMSEESSAAAASSAKAAHQLDDLAIGMQKIVSAYRLEGDSQRC